MRNRIARRVACALYATTALVITNLAATPAEAQAPMKHPLPDGNGVDVIYGIPWIRSGSLTIGQPDQGGLEFYRVWQGGGALSNFASGISGNGTNFTVKVGFSIETFTLVSGVYQSDDGMGSTLTFSGSLFTYTTRDGTVVRFQSPGVGNNSSGQISSITKPNGLTTNFWYKSQQFCEKDGTTCVGTPDTLTRLQSVTTNTGYHLKFIYGLGSSSTPKFLFDEDAWSRLAQVIAINTAFDYCDANADDCGTLPHAWPSVTISQQTGGINQAIDVWTDALANATNSTVTDGTLTSIQSPANPSVDFSLTYDANGRVATFTRGGGTWNYTYADNGTQRTTTVTQPGGGSKIYVSDTSTRELLSVTDELGHTTSYQYDSFARPTRITKPEGNYTQLTYDARGNVTETRNVAKAGSGLTDIVSSAAFPASCTNAKTCNEATSATDARGNTSDYTYDVNHGGVLTVTQPASTTGAVRPQVRYGYTALSAYYKNSSGTIVADPAQIYELTSASTCQTGSSCTGTADEVKATIAYGSAGVANNLLPTSVSKGSGDGALTATTSRAYDIFGNVTSIDGPLAGTADTSGFQYDANGQLTMSISPDPDGAGALKMRAQRFTYDANGNVTKVEAGTTTSLTGTFTPVTSGERVERTYDSIGRKITDALVSGTGTSALTQYSYDSKGRLSCTAQRMNPSVFGSLPSDACTLGTAGSFGPDRITKSIYDNADEVTQVQIAVGTTDAANERTLTFSANGELATLKDAENNLTTYAYDGFDRLSQTRYPNPTKGSGTSSSTDYGQLGYDAGSNVTSRRLRDGATINYTLDNLGRPTLKDLPGTEPDVSYSYDNLGRLTSASETGNALSFTYDALGRNLTETGPQGTVTSAYDLAGNRTQLTYPGTGLFVNYDYLTTGEVSKVRENGATTGIGVLATFGYDDTGNRTSLTYGNGVVQTYGYDPVSRLTTLTTNLTDTNDLTIGGSTTPISYNPASQILSAPRSNDTFSWNGSVAVNRSYTANGLNQYTAAGSAIFTYDAKGNLTSDGTNTYGYSSENLLTSAPGATLSYDPLLRLYQVSGTTTMRLTYDGLNLLADYDGVGTLQHRYVFGPGIDEPIVEYAGSGTTSRTFLSADERGSIFARSGNTGALVTSNTYDESGIPGSGNAGLFQYTGQAWISQLGFYYYKARMYSPTLGRFMQTDPLGYDGDGPNLYAYVLNDPANFTDPLGLRIACNFLSVADGPWVYRCISDDHGPSGWGGANLGGPNAGREGVGRPERQQPKQQSKKNNDRCSAGRQAAGISRALNYTDWAHDGFKAIAKAGGGGEAAERALGPVGWALTAASSISKFVSSIQTGEPIDVAAFRAAAPIAGAIGGTYGGTAAGALAGGLVGGVVGEGAGAVPGAVVGGAAGGLVGGVVGEKVGDVAGDGYAKLRGYGGC